jgi:hypothetical protein
MCFYGCKKSSKETVGSPDTAEVVGQYTTDPTYVPKYDALRRQDRGWKPILRFRDIRPFSGFMHSTRIEKCISGKKRIPMHRRYKD